MQVNDGTKPCPTCLNATNISTLKAVADLREEERKNAMVVLQLDRDLATLREKLAMAVAALREIVKRNRPGCGMCAETLKKLGVE